MPASAALFETFLTILIIDVPFFLIREYLVCILEFLELLFVSTAVWMVFESEFPE
jgi:hypothetical protein